MIWDANGMKYESIPYIRKKGGPFYGNVSYFSALSVLTLLRPIFYYSNKNSELYSNPTWQYQARAPVKVKNSLRFAFAILVSLIELSEIGRASCRERV